MEKINVSVYQIVGSEICVSADDGNKVYNRIKDILSKKKKVILSFLNVTMLTSAFLNTAIGQLYGQFSKEEIKLYFSVTDLSKLDLTLLKRVVDNAKNYYDNPDNAKRIEKTIKEVLG